MFVADNVEATIFAIDVGDADAASEPRPIDVDNLDTRLEAYLGCSRDDVFIRDMAVHPSSKNVYLPVMRGSGEAAVPILIRVGMDGALSEVPLEDVPFSQTLIENPPAEDDACTEVRLVQGNREGEVRERDGVRYRVARDILRTIALVKAPASNPNSMTILCSFSRCETVWGPVLGGTVEDTSLECVRPGPDGASQCCRYAPTSGGPGSGRVSPGRSRFKKHLNLSPAIPRADHAAPRRRRLDDRSM